jgi:REP-associated tyrosine transposase
MSYEALRKGRWSAPGQVYLITTVTHRRHPHFADLTLGRRVVSEMRSLHKAGMVDSLAWVLMPDHLHWLIRLGERSDLATVMKRFKARSARAVNDTLGLSGPIWQRAYHDHALRARRTFGRWRAMSLETPCAPGWWTTSENIRCGTPHGCDGPNEFGPTPKDARPDHRAGRAIPRGIRAG